MTETKHKSLFTQEIPVSLTGEVKVLTPEEQARAEYAGAIDGLRNIANVVGAGSLGSEKVDTAVASYVTEATNRCGNDVTCAKGALEVGVAEIAQLGLQPETATVVAGMLDAGVSGAAEALQTAEKAGADIQEIIQEIDSANGNQELLASETVHRLRQLREYTRLCRWDSGQNRVTIDQDKFDAKKRSLMLAAREEADILCNMVAEDGYMGNDLEVSEIIEGVERVNFSDKIKEVRQSVVRLERMIESAKDDRQKERMQKALAKSMTRLEWLESEHGAVDKGSLSKKIRQLLESRATNEIDAYANRAVEELEAAIVERIESNKYPWTMITANLVSDSSMEQMRRYYDRFVQSRDRQSAEVSDTAYIRVPGLFDDPEARKLFEAHDIHQDSATGGYSRKELAAIGVFFVNTVGEGEKRVMSGVIKDNQGKLDLTRKAFLTKEELDRVYAYQRRNGYGIGDIDPDDVVMDMIVADTVRESSQQRKYDLKGVERIDKYGPASSLFIGGDSRHLPGGFGGDIQIDGLGTRRFTAVQVDLINGHKDYIGLSEMDLNIDRADWDQRYMTARQYVDYVYVAPPTPEEVYYAIAGGHATKREMAWTNTDSCIIK